MCSRLRIRVSMMFTTPTFPGSLLYTKVQMQHWRVESIESPRNSINSGFYQKKDRSRDVFPSIADPKISYVSFIVCFFLKPFQTWHTTTTFVSILLRLPTEESRTCFWRWILLLPRVVMVDVGATGLGRGSAAAHSCAAKMPRLHRTLQGRGHKAPRSRWSLRRHISLY